MLQVDFIAGAVAHRRKYGGGKGQQLAKAIGIKAKIFPSVLDVTAGLGKDAFVLATLGCNITLLERHRDVFLALQTGLDKARQYGQEHDPEMINIVNRMQLFNKNSIDYLCEEKTIAQQVIYIDPMFPERKKTAAVKKDMVQLQNLVGDDLDGDELFSKAMESGVARVVVKRPRHAPNLANQAPPLVFEGKSCRFDVYPLRKIN